MCIPAIFTASIAALLAASARALRSIAVRLRDRERSSLEPGARVEVLTPDGNVLSGTLVRREETHFWVALDPGDVRLRVPHVWVSRARRRAPRRPSDSETGSQPPGA